jgi:hypothetical protein
MSESEIENVCLVPVIPKITPAPPRKEPIPPLRKDKGDPWDRDLVGWTEGMMQLEATRYPTFAKELEGATTIAESFARWEKWKKQKLERKKNWMLEFAHLTDKIGQLMKEKYSEARYVEGEEEFNYPEGRATMKWYWERPK